MKNNLFYYATKELSQDAFICWLVSFALDETDENPALTDCAKKLLALFVPELEPSKVRLLQIERQVGNPKDGYIDILLTASCNEKIYKIIIEDKTFTEEHDNQLKNYFNRICAQNPETTVRGVYYKTGFQSDLSNVLDAEYRIVSRVDILTFLGPYVNKVHNDIFTAYYEYWNEFQKTVDQYRHTPISQWGWQQINGCYSELKDSGFFADQGLWEGYGYVANQNGGFYGMWVGDPFYEVTVDGKSVELFLQLEAPVEKPMEMQLCLKLCMKDEKEPVEVARRIRDRIVYLQSWEYALEKYHFRKPKRLGSGRHMTIGVYNTEFSDFNSVKAAFSFAIQDYQKILRNLKKNIL